MIIIIDSTRLGVSGRRFHPSAGSTRFTDWGATIHQEPPSFRVLWLLTHHQPSPCPGWTCVHMVMHHHHHTNKTHAETYRGRACPPRPPSAAPRCALPCCVCFFCFVFLFFLGKTDRSRSAGRGVRLVGDGEGGRSSINHSQSPNQSITHTRTSIDRDKCIYVYNTPPPSLSASLGSSHTHPPTGAACACPKCRPRSRT